MAPVFTSALWQNKETQTTRKRVKKKDVTRAAKTDFAKWTQCCPGCQVAASKTTAAPTWNRGSAWSVGRAGGGTRGRGSDREEM